MLAADVSELRRIRAQQIVRHAARDAVRAELFDLQQAIYDDPCQSVAVHPGRRSGKSEFVPRGAVLDVLNAGFDEVVVIGAETQKKARALHWRKLERLVRKHKLPLTPNRQDGTWSTPWGAMIVFWGITDDNAVELLRGFKLASAYFDEVATYAEHLEHLTNSIIQPALQDTGGKLYLLGTPSFTRAGPWFKICDGQVPGWSVHHWDMRQNKRFPRDAQAAMDAVRKANGWSEDHATFRREYLGLFVNDPTSLVYHYVAEQNDVLQLPAHYFNRKGEIDHDAWLFVLGVDFGMTKPCAWVAWGWHRHERRIYSVHAEKHAGLLTDDAAKITARLCTKLRPVALVGDVGGLGKPYAEEWNQRYAGRNEQLERGNGSEYVLPQMKPADKLGKLGHVRMFNNELGARPPRAVLLQPASKPYADELATLPYYKPDAPEENLKEHPAHENHCCDAGLYSYIETRTFFNEAPDPALASRDPDEAMRWAERQEAAQLERESRQADWERC